MEVRSWNLDIILSNIICQLHAKLNFGIFCYSLRWLENVCKFSSCIKKQKQINYEQCSMRWRDLGSVESASRKVFLKTWRIIINCQNVLQWHRTATQLLCSIIILSVSELSQPTHCRLEWQFSQLTHCIVEDTVAPIHRIIASIVIFGNVFQMNYNFIFTGRKSVCRENRPILW